MRGRAHVFELHARLGTWEKTTEAIQDPDVTDDLVLRVREWAKQQVLGPRTDRDAAESGDLQHLDARVVWRWANEQVRYATDADFDDSDWKGPVEVKFADLEAALAAERVEADTE